jgi:exodeoxyribonuclease-3
MKIVSWNVNSLRARLDVLDLYIQAERPDLLFLQETKVMDGDFPVSFFLDRSYHVSYWGQKSYNGVAIAAIHPITFVVKRNITIHQEARYIEASIGPIRAGCVYVPNGQSIGSEAFQKKMDFFQNLRNYLLFHVKPKFPFFVLAGDFNVALTDDDVYDAKAYENHLLCSADERKHMRALIYDGWYDGAGEQEKNAFTWWPYQGRAFEKDEGLRLDYFLFSPALMDRVLSAGVSVAWREKIKVESVNFDNGKDMLCPSDHAPIWANIKAEGL